MSIFYSKNWHKNLTPCPYFGHNFLFLPPFPTIFFFRLCEISRSTNLKYFSKNLHMIKIRNMQISLKKHVKLKKFAYFQVRIMRIFHFLPFSNMSFPNLVEFFYKTPYFETFKMYHMRILFFYANFEYFFQKKFAYSFSSNCEEYSRKKIYSKICKF